ncbi:MAG: chemotaxis protein CheD [Chloroflexi bacterium]|nr:chemotaxis protein CheD [Chloroflexota bacterium]
MRKDPISLGLGERAVSRNPEDVLVAYGLGSCLGISMIDPQTRISALLHAVLPGATNGLSASDPNAHKYVDTGIESLVDAVVKEGANKARLIVRIIGGANMLISPGMANSFDIGTRNMESARRTLQRLNLKIAAEEVGGHTGRTVHVYVGASRVTVRVIGEKERDI